MTENYIFAMQGFGDYKPSQIVGGGESKRLQRCNRPCSYQDKVGTLTAKMSEGYCGQDAYNDMFIVTRFDNSKG